MPWVESKLIEFESWVCNCLTGWLSYSPFSSCEPFFFFSWWKGVCIPTTCCSLWCCEVYPRQHLLNCWAPYSLPWTLLEAEPHRPAPINSDFPRFSTGTQFHAHCPSAEIQNFLLTISHFSKEPNEPLVFHTRFTWPGVHFNSHQALIKGSHHQSPHLCVHWDPAVLLLYCFIWNCPFRCKHNLAFSVFFHIYVRFASTLVCPNSAHSSQYSYRP